MLWLYNFNRLLNDRWLWYWPLLWTAPHELNVVLRSSYFAQKKNETPYKTRMVLLHLVARHPFCLLSLHISHRDRLLFYQIPKFPALSSLSHMLFLPPTFLGQLLCSTHPPVPRVGVPAPLCVFYICLSSLCPRHTHFFLGFCLLCPLVYCLSLHCLTFLWWAQFLIQARCSCDYVLNYLHSLGFPSGFLRVLTVDNVEIHQQVLRFREDGAFNGAQKLKRPSSTS